MSKITCPTCGGYGLVSDYGNGEDFYGAKECHRCRGSGMVTDRSKKQQEQIVEPKP